MCIVMRIQGRADRDHGFIPGNCGVQRTATAAPTIAGGEDRDNNAVSFRYREGSQVNGVSVDEAIELITSAISEKKQV